MSRSKRLQRKRKRLYYRIKHQKEKPNKFIYSLELTLAYFVEAFRRLFVFLFVCSFLALIIGLIGFKFYAEPIYNDYKNQIDEIVQNSSREDFALNEGSVIYDKDGKVIANLYQCSNLKYLTYDEIPEDVVNAFIAIEDRTFWENEGYDLKGIIRVGIRYILTMGAEEHGASTITQQLARNVYLTHEVSIERKIKEILIARELTDMYSKEDILEFYCNDVCFANGIYGIQGASKAYFSKGVSKLTLSEIAYLCAIPNRPEYYNPLKFPENALSRRDKILRDMYECNFITYKQLTEALNQEIKIKTPKYKFNNYEASYAIDCSVRYLMKLDGFKFKCEFDSMDDYYKYHKKYDKSYEKAKDKLYTGGYKIYTTLDIELYNKLQKKLNSVLSFDKTKDSKTKSYALQGALTVVDNKTRKVVALVGGRNPKSTTNVYSLNRAYQSYRQPGSSIKPLVVYTPALENGFTADSTVYDIDVTTAKRAGVNVQALRGTSMTLRSAVERSRNGVAWQVFDKLTPKKGLGYAVDMKFSNLCPSDYYNSSALGGLTYGVTTVEMAEAYSTLANHGKFVEATCLRGIKDSDGKNIYKEPKSYSVYSKLASDRMVDILKGVLTHGTATGLGWYNYTKTEAFCKTGTTNASKDGWLCGATPYYSIAVWVGYDTPRTLSNLYGATYPGQIWRDSMLTCIEGKETKTFSLNTSASGGSSTGGGYYSYLEGRSDSEVLSSGYTVADYRKDRVIGESIYAVIDKMNDLDTNKSGYAEELKSLYEEGLSLIDTIYSVKYTSEMSANLNSAYSSLK